LEYSTKINPIGTSRGKRLFLMITWFIHSLK
jgi:hypothetical protein